MGKRKLKMHFDIFDVHGIGKVIAGSKAKLTKESFLERVKKDFGYKLKSNVNIGSVEEGILKYYPTSDKRKAGFYLVPNKINLSTKIWFVRL